MQTVAYLPNTLPVEQRLYMLSHFIPLFLSLLQDVNPGYTKRGRRRSPNAPLITDLVLFFIESEVITILPVNDWSSM